MNKTERIERLQMVIKHLHGCASHHLNTESVHEVFQDHTVWQGDVEVFNVAHKNASFAYAWSYHDDTGQEHMTAVLAIPPIKTALDAVRASIAAEAKKRS